MRGRVLLVVLASAAALAGSAHAVLPSGNVILNPGAEANSSGPPNLWSVTSTFEVVTYGTSTFPGANSPGCPARGNNFFAGGNTAVSTASQSIDLGASATEFDAGNVYAHLAGYLGGFSGQNDNMVVETIFRDGSMAELGRFQIGPVTASDRSNVTGMLLRTAVSAVPVGTRTVDVLQTATRTEGTYDDGYSDCLALIFDNDPTAVALRSFTAQRTSRGTALRWQTAAAGGVAGFHVFRQDGAVRHQLTRRLIRAAFVGSGARYGFVDRASRTSARTYWLQAVGLDGSRRWIGSTLATT